MAATLSEPHLLGNFFLSSKHIADRKGKGVAPDERPHIFASKCISFLHDVDEAVLAVQGDGIHIYELSDFHQVCSITTGPSTSLGMPVSVTSLENGAEYRRTFAPIQNIDESQGNTRKLKIWEGPASGIASSSKSSEKLLDHSAIHLFSSLDQKGVIAYGDLGEGSFLDYEANVKSSWSPLECQDVVKHLVFPRKGCHFVPNTVPPNALIAAIFYRKNSRLFVHVSSLFNYERTVIEEQVEIPVANTEDIIDVTFDVSGHASVLGSSGALVSFKVEYKEGAVSVASSSNTAWVDKLAFVGQSAFDAKNQVSVTSLSSSFVLLAGITTSSDIALLLADIQYGVVFQATKLPIPASVTQDASSFALRLERASSAQALLILTPRSIRAASAQPRSSVFVVPFSVPERSTIANALVMADTDSPWLVASESILGDDDETDEEAAKRLLLERVREAIEENRPLDADSDFFKWLRPREIQALDSAKDDKRGDDEVNGDVDMDKENSKKFVSVKKSSEKSTLDHDFTSQLLTLVLQVNESKKQAYSPKICRLLVSKRAVSQSMIKGGLIRALAEVNDWDTLRECFLNVVDISEYDALDVLTTVMKLARTPKHTRTSDSMAVDDGQDENIVSHSNIPPLRTLFAYVVNYAGSLQAWRLAIYKHFPQAEDILELLGIIEEWMKVYGSKDLQLSLGETKLNEQGVPVPKFDYSKKLERVKGMLLPPLDKILLFLQALLDASFLKIVQEPPAVDLLRRISELIKPHVMVNIDLEALRGPLAPFDKARAQAVAAAKEGRRKDGVDWRKKRRQEQEQAALALGPYQVEELVF